MKIIFTSVLLVIISQIRAQEHSSAYEQQLEQLAAQEESEPEDDAYWQHLELRRRHRLNINNAASEDLRELNLLTDLQIDNLFQYKKLFGPLINIYELQAIPGWDLHTIRNLLPFVAVQEELDIPAGLFGKGEYRWLFRFSQVIEKAKGFQGPDSSRRYAGSPLKILFRYKYQYRDRLQYGITADKDAGEEFFKGNRPAGFDFYSFHFFMRKLGFIKAFALGDFIINLGQGLIHWQGQAFKKSAAVLNIKRQGAVLKPYTSAGEYNFHRGAAITLQHKNWLSTIFASFRKWSAAVQVDGSEEYMTSAQVSGYHRTKTELENRNAVGVFAAGGNLQFRNARGQVGLNTIYHSFSIPFRSSGDAYDLYAISGNNWYNTSIDYSYTYANFHMYGEYAVDKNFNAATLHGLLFSAHRSVDLSLVYRNINPAYQAVAANAFTENTQPANENGLYAGLSFRATHRLVIDAYGDFFRFPWLKYRVDKPSEGTDYLLQVSFTPGKHAAIYTRWRIEEKLLKTERVRRKNWRNHVSLRVSKEWSLANRVEIVWFENAGSSKQGFLFFQDIQYSPLNSPYKFALRLQYFETDDYDTRLYAYENSVMYNLSLPAFFNRGVRWYATGQYKTKINKMLSCIIGVNISRSSYAGGSVIGSGQDELPGSNKTELKFQAIFSL